LMSGGGGWCDQPWGLILSPKSCGQESPKRALQSIFFELDGETIGGQGIEKSFQMEKVCLPVLRFHMGVVHVCKQPLRERQWCGPSFIEKSVQR
jgi:hypothetical protein